MVLKFFAASAAISALVVALLLVSEEEANADPIGWDGSTNDESVTVWTSQEASAASSLPVSSGGSGAVEVQRRYMFLCTDGIYPAEGAVCPSSGVPASVDCGEGLVAVMPLWERSTISQDPVRWGPWRMILGSRCVAATEFEADVLEAWGHMVIPAHQITVQPDQGWVFSSVPTIVMVDREPRQITTPILGRNVLIRAVPHTMAWDWGHGDPTVTADLGSPYPDHTLTHTYSHFEGDVAITVTSTWSGQYSLDAGTTWHPAPGTATTTSTAQPLTVYNPHTHLVACEHTAHCDN